MQVLVNRNCGGTLISATHILTAAHCTVGYAASSMEVFVGVHDITDNQFNRVNVAEIIIHPNYEPQNSHNNDYSILRLAKPVTFTKKVRPACLPSDLSASYAGVHATVTGWGDLSSGVYSPPNVLQEVDVTVATNAECKSAYASKGFKITSNMVCAGDSGKDSCHGDSGGPLITSENGRQALVI